MPYVEVAFDIDVNNILHVLAKDKDAGREQSITIKDFGILSKEEIELMAGEAELRAEKGRRRREETEVSNNVDALAYQLDRQLRDPDNKVSPREKAKVGRLIGDDRAAINNGANIGRLKNLPEKLKRSIIR